MAKESAEKTHQEDKNEKETSGEDDLFDDTEEAQNTENEQCEEKKIRR